MTTVIATPPTRARSQVRRRALAVSAAVLAALVGWSVPVLLLGVDVTVRTAPGSSRTHPVGAGAVLAASLLASLLGWSLLALLERRVRRARLAWTLIAGAGLLGSLAGPLALAATSASAISLLLLHLSVAAVLIPLLRRTTGRH